MLFNGRFLHPLSPAPSTDQITYLSFNSTEQFQMRKLTILSLVIAAGVLAAGSFLSIPTSGHKRTKFHRSVNPVPNRYIVVLDENQVGRFAEGPQVEAEAQVLSYMYGGWNTEE